MRFSVPYAKKSMEVEVPERNLAGVLESSLHSRPVPADEGAVVDAALDHPIGSLSLEALAAGKRRAVVITSDHTRPVPSHIIMPRLLERLRRNNPEIDITILVATGYHRPSTREELVAKLGKGIVDSERIAMHNSRDDSSLVRLRDLPSGGELWINRLAVEADLLVGEGFIEPHFFAGFSGGRKSVLPGVAGAKTVLANHCSEFIQSPNARAGVLNGNPIHRDMLFAAKEAKLAFIANVVINGHKRIMGAFAGDAERAHLQGCEFLAGLSRAKPVMADIVVVGNGGHPLDQNVYQAVKGMTAAEATCEPGGVIIMVASCSDGHGGQSFFDNLANASSPQALLERVAKVPRDRTEPDQWEFQILARILCSYTVIIVSDLCDPAMIKAMGLEHFPAFESALARAFELKGPKAKVTVVPDGVSIIVG